MGLWPCSWILVLVTATIVCSCNADPANSNSTTSFGNVSVVTGAQDNVTTSPDGKTWYLSLTKEGGSGFQTENKYLFGWFSMKLKLVAGDSAGVVTAYYMCSDLDAAPQRDELDFEFLGNTSGQPYNLQTNIYKDGVGGREMRHYLWFDPTADFHTYSILWNAHQIVFFVDEVPIRVHKNNGQPNSFFPVDKPMYLFSTIWNADDWATRGGLDKTDWSKAPFVSSYTDFNIDACQWEDPSPTCAGTTTDNWWDQSNAWNIDSEQQEDCSWLARNLQIYDYCTDYKRYPVAPEECSLRPATT